MTNTKDVHNHGTEEGAGLACPERRTAAGDLQGDCMRQRWTFSRRLKMSTQDFYMWHRRDEAGTLLDAWATPVAALLGRSS